MDMASAIASVLSKYASFSGRASRSEYWWFTLVYCVVIAALYCFDHFVLKFQYAGAGDLFSLALFLPGQAVSVRRLHDINKAGWNVFWAYQPYIAAIMVLLFAGTPTGIAIGSGTYALLWLLALPIGPILILYWACKRGDMFENEYGPNPLGEYDFI